jgi:hypothetical protein
MELSHPLYQHLQVVRPLCNLLLIFDQRWKKMFVRLLECVAQVNMKPPLGGVFPAAFEGNLQVIFPAIAVQHQPNAGEYLMLIVSRRRKILEQAGVRWNAKPELT